MAFTKSYIIQNIKFRWSEPKKKNKQMKNTLYDCICTFLGQMPSVCTLGLGQRDIGKFVRVGRFTILPRPGGAMLNFVPIPLCARNPPYFRSMVEGYRDFEPEEASRNSGRGHMHFVYLSVSFRVRTTRILSIGQGDIEKFVVIGLTPHPEIFKLNFSVFKNCSIAINQKW